MSTFETAATVESQGHIHLSGVPFPPGTKVDVTISLAQGGDSSPAGDRAQQLFAALDKARNTLPLSAFRRDELYDRNVLR